MLEQDKYGYRGYKERFPRGEPDNGVLKLIQDAQDRGELHPVIKDIIEVALSENPRIHPLREKIAIVIEGGGVAGAVSCYEAAALELLGWTAFGLDITDCIGLVVGSSSGAANAAYFARGRAIFGKGTYETLFSKPPFLNMPFKRSLLFFNPKTFLTMASRGMVDASYLIKYIKKDEIGYPDVDHSDTKLCVVATLVNRTLSGIPKDRTVRFDNFKNNEDFLGALQTSFTVPFAGGFRPKVFRGKRFFDGGIVEHIPVQTAIDEGFNRILALTSKPRNIIQRLTRVERGIATSYKILDSGFARLWLSRRLRAQETRKWLCDRSADGQPDPVFATLVAPEKVSVSTFESRPKVIRSGGIEGARSLFEAFGIRELKVQDKMIKDLLSVVITGLS